MLKRYVMAYLKNNFVTYYKLKPILEKNIKPRLTFVVELNGD